MTKIGVLPAPDPDDLENLISRQALAGLLGVSASGIDDLTGRGVVIRVDPRAYLLRESVAGYVKHLRDQIRERGQSLADEKTRQVRAQAEKVELANAKARGELVEAAAVEREWSALLMDVRARMLAVPSRVQARLGHLTAHEVQAIDAEVRAALTEAGNDE